MNTKAINYLKNQIKGTEKVYEIFNIHPDVNVDVCRKLSGMLDAFDYIVEKLENESTQDVIEWAEYRIDKLSARNDVINHENLYMCGLLEAYEIFMKNISK